MMPPVFNDFVQFAEYLATAPRSVHRLRNAILPRKNPFKEFDKEQCISVLRAMYERAIDGPPITHDEWSWDRCVCLTDGTWKQVLGGPGAVRRLYDISLALRFRLVDKPRFYLSTHYATMRLRNLISNESGVKALRTVAMEAVREQCVNPYEDFEEFEAQCDDITDYFVAQGWLDFKFKHEVNVDDDMKAKFEGLSDSLKKTLDVTNESVSSFWEVAAHVKMGMQVVPACIVLLSLILFCRGKSKKVWIPIVMLAIMPVTYAIVDRCGEWSQLMIKEKVEEVLFKFDQESEAVDSGVEFQAEANHESPIVGLALLLTSLVTIHEAPHGKRSTSFLKGIGEIPRLTDGLTTVSAFAIDLFVKCANEIRSWISGGDVEAWIVKTTPQVDNWCQKVLDVTQKAHDGNLAITLSNRDHVRMLEIEGARLTQMVFAGVEGIRVKNALASYGRMLKKVQDLFDGIAPAKKLVRQEPYTITCAGSPGVGKSWIIGMLIAEVVGRVLPDEDLPDFERDASQFIYHRFFEEEYWTDYHNQFVTVVDDFMQFRDVLGQAGEPLEFIRMVNNAPHTLHMADLASKGKVQFNSKIIVVNTNQKDFEVNSIVSKEALIRRMNMIIHVCPKVEFCTPESKGVRNPWDRVFDKNHPALKNCDGVQDFNEDVYELHRMRCPNPRTRPDVLVTEGVYTFQGMVRKIVEEYHSGAAVSDVYAGRMQERVSNIVKARKSNLLKEVAFGAQGGEEDVFYDADEEREVENSPKFTASGRRIYFDRQVSFNDIQSFSFWRGKRPVNLTSELCLADLEEESSSSSSSVDDTLSIEDLIPGRAYMWRLGSIREALHFFSSRFPLLWAQSKLDPVEAITSGRVLYHIAGAQSLIKKIMLKVDDETMQTYVLDHVFGPEVAGESRWRQDLKSHFVDVRMAAEAWLDKYPILKQVLKIGAALVAGAAIGLALSKLHGALTGHKGDEDGFVDESHPKNKREKPHKRPLHKPKNNGPNSFVSEGGGDQNNHNLCRKITEKALYTVKTLEGKRIGNAFVYCGRKCLIPYHYITMLQNMIDDGDIEEDQVLMFKSNFQSDSLPVTVRCMLGARRTESLVEKDLCVFILPDHFHQHPNLLPHFAPRDLVNKNLDYKCTLVMPNNLSTDGKPTYYWERLSVQYHPVKKSQVDGEVYDINEVFVYAAKTEKGDCGSILTIDDPSVLTKILGMHVAGTRSSGLGLSVMLCREDFDEVDRAFKGIGYVDYPPSNDVIDEFSAQAEKPPAEGTFIPYVKTLTIHQPKVTKLRKSVLYGRITKVMTAPAKLKSWRDANGDFREPLKEAIGRYGPPCIANLNPAVLEACTASLLARLLNQQVNPNRRRPCVFSFREAVLGIEGVKFCEAIPRSTSAGYPYVMNPIPGFKGKEWFFGQGEEYDLERPQAKALQEECEIIVKNARMGNRSFHAFVDTLKDETLSLEKVEIGKTRLVSACPLPLSIVTRQYFLDFSMFICENRIFSHCAVGINPYSMEWDMLAKRLRSKGDKVIGGDFSGYDTRQLAAILMAICKMINKWYNDGCENALVREVLFQEVVNSIHVSGDTIYQWSSKLPSGHPLTTILNSLQAVILLMLCWVDLSKDLSKLESFWEHVFPVTYGDDNIFNVSDEASSFFNLDTLVVCMTKFNQVYTDEDKGTVFVPFKKLEQCTFLKRGFRFDQRVRRYVAPLALASILDMLNWYMESPERLNTQKTNVTIALKELSLHDRFIFDKWSEIIIAQSREHLKFMPPVVDYIQLQDIVLNSELIW